MPPGWDRTGAGWLTVKLRDEEILTSIDKEFAMFVESERQQRDQLLSQTKVIRMLVIGGILVIVLLLIVATIWLFLKQRGGGLPSGH